MQIVTPDSAIVGGHEHGPWKIRLGPTESLLPVKLVGFSNGTETHRVTDVTLVRADAGSFRMRLRATGTPLHCALHGSDASPGLVFELNTSGATAQPRSVLLHADDDASALASTALSWGSTHLEIEANHGEVTFDEHNVALRTVDGRGVFCLRFSTD